MTKACSVDNVMGQLTGMAEAKGAEVEFGVIEDMTAPEAKAFSDVFSMERAEVYDSAPDKGGFVNFFKHLATDPLNTVKSVINDTRNPSGILGEARIKQVHNFIADHFEEYSSNLEAGRKEYNEGIIEILDDIDTHGLNPAQERFLNRYKQFYKDGGELYRANDGGNLSKAVSNVTGNIIQSSPTVILGNIAEGAIKLPTLYPKTFIQGAAEAWKNGLFKHNPEVARGGGYGSSISLEKGLTGSREGWQGLIGVTDTPLKNIAYYAGKLADGDGAKAVQRVAFVPRFGDMPAVYYSSGDRLGIQLLGYTVNTYKMYGQMWKDLGNDATRMQALQQIATFHIMAGAIGGAAGSIPKPVEYAIKTAFPETEEWFEENKNAFAGLIQPGSVDRLFVGGEIASHQIQKVGRNVKGVEEGYADRDGGRMVLETIDGLLNSLPLTGNVLGDAQIQRIKDLALDVAKDELDLEDVPEAAKEKFLPFTAK